MSRVDVKTGKTGTRVLRLLPYGTDSRPKSRQAEIGPPFTLSRGHTGRVLLGGIASRRR